ncbi:MAG: DUF1573 domain-containing protein [Planctomycetota bacterium]|jgi:hypothetical protein
MQIKQTTLKLTPTLIITLLCLSLQIVFAAEDNTSPKNAVLVPKLKIQNKTINFGKVYGSTTVKGEIKFTNEGDAPLKIKKVKPSCGCMAGKLTKKVYQPGESGTIKVSYKVKNRKGPAKGTFTINSNDPKQPNAKVNLKANAVLLIETTPANLTFSNLEVGESTTKKIHVTTKQPLLVEAAVRFQENENLKVEITPKQQNITDKGADFNITVTPSVIGRHTNGIAFKSKEGLENPIEINSSLVAVAEGPVIAKPKYLFFTIVQGEAKDRALHLSSKDPNATLTIEKLDYDKKMLDIVENKTDKKNVANLLVSPKLEALSDTNQLKTRIKIKAKVDAKSTNLSIPVSLYKRASKTKQPPQNTKQASNPAAKPTKPPPDKK